VVEEEVVAEDIAGIEDNVLEELEVVVVVQGLEQ
jgi:hypothetical protein